MNLIETSFVSQKGTAGKIEELTELDVQKLGADPDLQTLFPSWYASNLWNGKTVPRNHHGHRWLRDQLNVYQRMKDVARLEFLLKALKYMKEGHDKLLLLPYQV